MKAILITGCSSGIGLATALALQTRGYLVIASCRQAQSVAGLKDMGLKHVIVLDLADTQSILDGVEHVKLISQGKLFALFNNAGFGVPGAVEDLTRDALRHQFETNVFGTHELTRLLLPMLLQQADARVIQNSSVLGFVSVPARGAYIASKHALEGLTDTLRIELMGTSVKVSIIEPGPITSAFRKNALANFERFIDVTTSRHAEMYTVALARLTKEGPAMRFTLPASAVVDKVIHALESPKPKVRYYVTAPTYLMGFLKRILPSALLDKFIVRFASA